MVDKLWSWRIHDISVMYLVLFNYQKQPIMLKGNFYSFLVLISINYFNKSSFKAHLGFSKGLSDLRKLVSIRMC